MTATLVFLALLMGGGGWWLVRQTINVKPWVASAPSGAQEGVGFPAPPKVALGVLLAVITSLFRAVRQRLLHPHGAVGLASSAGAGPAVGQHRHLVCRQLGGCSGLGGARPGEQWPRHPLGPRGWRRLRVGLHGWAVHGLAGPCRFRLSGGQQPGQFVFLRAPPGCMSCICSVGWWRWPEPRAMLGRGRWRRRGWAWSFALFTGTFCSWSGSSCLA